MQYEGEQSPLGKTEDFLLKLIHLEGYVRATFLIVLLFIAMYSCKTETTKDYLKCMAKVLIMWTAVSNTYTAARLHVSYEVYMSC